MLSTVDWEAEMTTMAQTLNYSSEDMTTSAASGSRMVSLAANPYSIALIVIGVLGTVTNALVLGGFWYAGRAKMNVSSAHIANHTTLEQSTFSRMNGGSSSVIFLTYVPVDLFFDPMSYTMQEDIASVDLLNFAIFLSLVRLDLYRSYDP